VDVESLLPRLDAGVVAGDRDKLREIHELSSLLSEAAVKVPGRSMVSKISLRLVGSKGAVAQGSSSFFSGVTVLAVSVSLDVSLAVEAGVPRAGWPVLGVPAFGPVWGVLRILLDGELLTALDCVATRAIGVAAACAPVGVLTSCLRFGVCPDLPGCGGLVDVAVASLVPRFVAFASGLVLPSLLRPTASATCSIAYLSGSSIVAWESFV